LIKHPLRWALLLALFLGIVFGIGRAIVARKAQQTALAQSTASVASDVVHLTASDVLTLQPVELLRSVGISGSIRAVHSAVVKARVAGEVTQINVREGDSVRQGQLLATLDTQDLQTRLRQAQQQSAAAQAQHRIARQTLDNNQALVQQGFISKNALQTSESNAAAALANLEAARAAQDLARQAVADTRLTAPMAGQVAQRFVQAGERVMPDARVVEIVDLRKLEMQASVSPEDLALVKLGSVARLKVDGLSEPVTARVARINPSTSPGTRSIPVYLSVDPHPGLRQGLFAQGNIELDRQEVLALPVAAIRQPANPDAAGASAFVQLIENERIVHRPVTVGASGHAASGPFASTPTASAVGGTTALRAITAGLKAGDRVLGDATGLLAAGTRVTLPSTPVGP